MCGCLDMVGGVVKLGKVVLLLYEVEGEELLHRVSVPLVYGEGLLYHFLLVHQLDDGVRAPHVLNF